MTVKTIVDVQGHMVELCVLENDEGVLLGYNLKDGEHAVDYLNDAVTVTNDYRHPPLKPRWDGTAWTDEATAAELEAAFPPAAPSRGDVVNDRLDALESLLVDTQYQLALTELGLSGEV